MTLEEYILDFMDDYQKAKEHLFLKVREKERIMEPLKKLVHREVGGLILTCHLFVVTKYKQVMTCNALDRKCLETYKISAKQLFEDTIENSMKYFPAKIERLCDMVGPIYGMEEKMRDRILIVTNDHTVGGASALFYPGVLEEVGKRMKENYYVLPSSIHEVIAVGESVGDESTFLRMVHTVNRFEVEEKDWLSDRLFHYDLETKSFERL